MKKNLSRFLSILLCFLILVQPCFAYSGVSYAGEIYYGISSDGIKYDGDVYEPVFINGIEVLPISVSGTTYEGQHYRGIALSEIKITQITISGDETADTFYSEDVPEEFRANWNSVLTKFAIGTSVIVVTGVLTLITGGQVGYICAAAFTGALGGSVSGAILGAILQGTLSALNGDPSEQVFYETVSGAADGYMWGAITGAITGAIAGASQLAKGSSVLDSNGRVSALVNECGDVLDPKTGRVIGHGAMQSKNGEYLYYIENYGGVNHYVDFDGNRLNLRRLGDLVLDGTDTKTAPIYGIVDSSDGLLYIGDDAIRYLNSGNWNIIKKATEFSNLSDEIIYTGKYKHPTTLGMNMEKAIGCKIPRNASRHHIVPWDEKDPNAELARQVLKKFNIDIDSAYNGAILPQGAQSQADALGMAYHRTLHSAKYYQELQIELSRCQTRNQVIDVLNDFRKALYSNNLFWL